VIGLGATLAGSATEFMSASFSMMSMRLPFGRFL
jgi:hypothetical protein